VEVICSTFPAAIGRRGTRHQLHSGARRRISRWRERALAYQALLGTKQLHSMAGIVPVGVDPLQCRATLVSNLKYAAKKLATHNLTLLLEAINTPRYARLRSVDTARSGCDLRPG